MRLIDAEELKKNEPNYHEGFRVFTESEIDAAPSVTPEELTPLIDLMCELLPEIVEAVKNCEPQTGEWLSKKSIASPSNFLECSVCGFGDFRNSYFNYCPNCGAKCVGGMP